MDLGLVALGAARNRGIGLALPAGNGFGIALIGALQRLLRGQPQARQDRADRGQTQAHAETLGDQVAHDLAGPQATIKPVLQRILAVDPSTHLPLLRPGQGPWAACRWPSRQGLESLPATAGRLEPAVNGAPVKPIAGDHRARPFALPHTSYGHRPDGL